MKLPASAGFGPSSGGLLPFARMLWRTGVCGTLAPMKVDRSIKLADHATVRTLKARNGVGPYNTDEVDAEWLREVALEAGADDVGFVSLDDPAVAEECDYVREALSGARSLVAICLRSN